MSTRIYNPIAVTVGDIQLTFIRVGKIDYYPIYLLPMDAERGRYGFPTTPQTVERDICDAIAKDYKGGLPEELIAMLNDDVKASMGIDTNLHSFNVNGMDGKVPCLSDNQLIEVVLSYARNKDCEYCWDLLGMYFLAGILNRNDVAMKAAKTRAYEPDGVEGVDYFIVVQE